MVKRSSLTTATLTAVFLSFSAAQANAITRAWVSGHGADVSGCGAPTNPCRSLQYVVTNIIAAGGEIDVLDPAGYGPVTIPFALSIVNDGVGTAGVQQATSSQNGITINAGSTDNVTLRALNIDGLGVAKDGIRLNSAGSLTVVDCVVRHFALNGIAITPTSGSLSFLISNTTVADNGGTGINYNTPSGSPTAKGVIDHVTAVNNFNGFAINTYGTGGATSVTIDNSIASNNSVGGSGVGIGIIGGATGPTVTVDRSYINNNGGGIYVAISGAAPIVLLGRSVVTSNTNDGVFTGTATNSFYTYGDN